MKKISTAGVKLTQNVSEQKLTIGLDLGDRSSWYCVLDEAGEVLLEQRLGTTRQASGEAYEPLRHSRPGLLPAAEYFRLVESEAPRPAPSSGDCVYGLAPTCIARWEQRSTNRWQHRLQREHPTGTERNNRSTRVRMEGWRQGCFGRKARTEKPRQDQKSGRPLPFLPDGMVTDRSSPSRVRWRRKERALDRSGPLCTPSARKEGGF